MSVSSGRSSSSEYVDPEAPMTGSGLYSSSPDLGHLVADKPVVPKSYQVKALVRKQLKLQLRQKCTLVCQCLVPLLLTLTLGAMQVMFNVLVKDNINQDLHIPHAETFPNWEKPFADRYFDVVTNGVTQVGNLSITGNTSGFIGHIPQNLTEYIGDKGIEMGYFPYADLYPNLADWKQHIKKLKQKYLSILITGKEDESFHYPSAVVSFDELKLNPNETMNISFGLATEQQQGYPNFEDFTEYSMSAFLMLAQSYAEYVLPNATIVANYQELPYKNGNLSIDIGSFLAALFYPFVLSFILPVFVYNIVLEKQEKLREMQKMMGLKMRNYWMVTFFYDWTLYILVLTIVVIISLAFQFAIFTQASPLVNLITYFLWGNMLIGLAFVTSTVFSRTRTSTILCYLVIILAVVISYVVNIIAWGEDMPPFWWLIAFPPFTFYRILFILGLRCGQEKCPKITDLTWNNDYGGQIIQLWLYMIVETIIMFALTNYLDNVLPKEFGVSKKPWYPIKPFYKYLIKKPYRKFFPKKEKESTGEKTPLLTSINSTEMNEFMEPSDVARERERVYQSEIPEDSPVVIVDLHKKYSSGFGRAKKVAVKSLTFSIPRGECFGLLGPNGAGKTTTISMLTGMFPPTAGYAKIGSFDIRTEINKVHRVMGVCPQFDTLWGDLTCEETLLYYARLKGIGNRFFYTKEEGRHVDESLRQVGLEAFKKRLVKKLSGGMRRRLSVAVSLIGNPRIVFLDEPTTGLDPESRRKLWDVLSKVKEDRSIILTTHSMEEADVLCDRIGIMSLGTLRCVGPQHQLKSRFGAGYTLKINYQPEDEANAQNFISSILPSSTLVENFAGQSTFQIPKPDMVISRLFEQMSESAESGISDWGINQTTLEDVFLSIVRNEEDK